MPLFPPPPSLCLPANPLIQIFPLPATLTPPRLIQIFPISAVSTSFPYSSPYLPNPNQHQQSEQEEEENHVIGDCLVFDDGAFEHGDPFLRPDPGHKPERTAVASECLVPEKWKEAAEVINLTKKVKRRISHQLKFGSRMERRNNLPVLDVEEYQAYREMKLAHLNPQIEAAAPSEMEGPSRGGRVAPRNPRLWLGGETMDDITDFFNSGDYTPGEINDDKKKQGKRKLFTKEEKAILHKRIPNLAEATSNKWLPLHTLVASGEFYVLDILLKHNVDINAVDKDGLSAIHRAIFCKKQAIFNYLLRNSANPFVRDKTCSYNLAPKMPLAGDGLLIRILHVILEDGATLIHYAVQTASSKSINILLLYNVDINLSDNDGWTPLHLAVQTQRTDIVRLLLMKGADKTLKNQEGLTPFDLCLYSGHDMRTYELIKLLKELPKSKSHP